MPGEIQLNLHPANFVIISGLVQCIILAGILICYRKGNKQANRIFGLFILICSLHFSWPLIMDINLEGIFLQVFWFPYSYLLAVGPLLFFYTKSLTESSFRISARQFIHFVPVLAEIVVQVYFIEESIKLNRPIYNVSGFLILQVIELVGTGVSILIYATRSLALIKLHEEWLQQNFSNQEKLTLSWLLHLIRYLKVVWTFWLAFELSFLFFWKFQLHMIPVYGLLYILLGLIIYSTYWIGIQGLIKSEVLSENAVTKTLSAESTTVYARLSDIELQTTVEALENLMQREKLYLHETLNLRTLANRLQKDPNLISYLLNSILHKSFFDYVNEFRIEEVKSRINNPAYAHLKIVEIAYESGFNSKATFNRVFRRFTGKSPSDYRNDSE